MLYVVSDTTTLFLFSVKTHFPHKVFILQKTEGKKSAFCHSFLTFCSQQNAGITCQPFFEQGFWYIIASVYILALVYLGIENLRRIYEVKGSVGSK